MPAPLDCQDALELRCPQLGGEVPFRYCRTMNDELPCARLEQCWHGRVAVEAFLQEHYSEAELQASATGRGRMETIFDTRARVQEQPSEE